MRTGTNGRTTLLIGEEVHDVPPRTTVAIATLLPEDRHANRGVLRRLIQGISDAIAPPREAPVAAEPATELSTPAPLGFAIRSLRVLGYPEEADSLEADARAQLPGTDWDDLLAARVGTRFGPAWRARYPDAIERLADAGARVLVWDAAFVAESEADGLLAASLRRIPVIAAEQAERTTTETLAPDFAAIGWMELLAVDGVPRRALGAPGRPPLGSIAVAAALGDIASALTEERWIDYSSDPLDVPAFDLADLFDASEERLADEARTPLSVFSGRAVFLGLDMEGVDSGTVRFMRIGGRRRVQFDIIGSAVNGASRFQVLTKERQSPLIVSAAVPEAQATFPVEAPPTGAGTANDAAGGEADTAVLRFIGEVLVRGQGRRRLFELHAPGISLRYS